MERMPICRICLVENVRMYIVADKDLHELYETLTDIPPNTSVKQGQLEFFSGLTKSPVENISIVDVSQIESVAVKEEIPTVCERLDYVIELKEEIQSDDLELEPADNGCSDVEDTPAHRYSGSDSEDDLPLKEFKMEVEEEQEVVSEKRRASDTLREPVAKKPKLHIPKTELEYVITEDQGKNKQSDKKVTQNCTYKTVTKYKESLTYTKPRVNNTNKSRIYAGVKPFKCEVCKRSFNRKEHLTIHIRIHTGEKPFECDLCKRSFNRKDCLRNHIRIHTGEKPYKCDICQRCFSEKTPLTSHIRTHTGEKPHRCKICHRSFNQKSSLTKHIRKHTGESPFKCDICHSCFKEKSHLTRHIRVHTGEKPYKCDVCQRVFSMSSSLTRHIRIHTGEKPYKCDICQHSFNKKDNLTRHIRIHT